MASVFKRKRKVTLANGKTVIKQSQKYYTRLTDADGIKRTIPLFRDKTASQQQAAQLVREVELADSGVVDRYKEHRLRPLVEHLEDFYESLLAKGCTGKHAKQVTSRVKRIIKGCKFRLWTDISSSKVQRYLADLRSNVDGISAQTFNFYLKSIKQLCTWMVQDRRAGESPLEHLKGLNVQTDRRHDRRALETDEVRRLLEATKAAPERFGMTGRQRAMLYRLAIETGLRASELRSLTVASFDLNKCTVTIQAAYSKHRRQDELPLHPGTAKELQSFIAVKIPTGQVFKVPDKTSKMFQADLADACIAYVDDSGRYADFHCLRHTTGSLLTASGAHPKIVQSIMRHSDINMTMSRYTHIFKGQESEAIAGLPDLSLPGKDSKKAVATGTDNESVDTVQNSPEKWTPKRTPFLTPTAFTGCNQSATVGNESDNLQENGSNDKGLNSRELSNKKNSLSATDTDKKQILPRGFEPLTFGSVDRCSIQLSYGRVKSNCL